MNTKIPTTPAEAMKIVAKTTFKPFDKIDWDAFAGCESEEPMLGEYFGLVIVIDGAIVSFHDHELTEVNFELDVA